MAALGRRYAAARSGSPGAPWLGFDLRSQPGRAQVGTMLAHSGENASPPLSLWEWNLKPAAAPVWLGRMLWLRVRAPGS